MLMPMSARRIGESLIPITSRILVAQNVNMKQITPVSQLVVIPEYRTRCDFGVFQAEGYIRSVLYACPKYRRKVANVDIQIRRKRRIAPGSQ